MGELIKFETITEKYVCIFPIVREKKYNKLSLEIFQRNVSRTLVEFARNSFTTEIFSWELQIICRLADWATVSTSIC